MKKNISIDNENKIILNVGGQRFETNKTTLRKIPATRLSRLTEALANYDKILNEYFFDRHPGVFSQVLNYYRTGKLHYPTNVCGPLFEAELEFWGLDSNQVEPCCWKTYTKHRDTEETLLNLEKLSLDEERSADHELARIFGLEEDPDWQSGTLPWYKKLRPLIWQLFNEPYSSKTSRVITFLSISFITISILTFCMGTVNNLCSNGLFCRNYNMRLLMPHEIDESTDFIHLSLSRTEPTPTILDYIEYICITWFTLEFTIKYIVAPKKVDFFKSVLNWIDLIANLWFYIDFVYNSFLPTENYETHPAWDMIGTIRIMRLFRFFNHYPGLKIIIASLIASAGVLRLLIFFIVVAMVIFSSIIFYAEKLTHSENGRNMMSSAISEKISKGSENEMTSIFETFWFSIASLTTVGFGDYSPRTPLGMIFGAMCTIAGVLMIDLPMPIIVSNFANYYNHLQARSKFPKRLRRKVLPVEAPRVRTRNSYIASFSIQQTLNTTSTLAAVTTNLVAIEKFHKETDSFLRARSNRSENVASQINQNPI